MLRYIGVPAPFPLAEIFLTDGGASSAEKRALPNRCTAGISWVYNAIFLYFKLLLLYVYTSWHCSSGCTRHFFQGLYMYIIFFWMGVHVELLKSEDADADWSRLAFRPPGLFWKNATKTRGGTARLPLTTSSRPRAPQRVGVRSGVGLVWADVKS